MIVTHQKNVGGCILLLEFCIAERAAVVAEGLAEIADILQAAMRIGRTDLALYLQQRELLCRCASAGPN